MIPRELLKEVRKIEAMSTRRVNDSMAGQYHSVFKGQGMDFDEVRPYREGDDIRAIDWNVSARMNEIFVKIFVEERELTVILMVDMSASGLLGTRRMTKRELAARVAALFGFAAIRNNDRVGVILFTDKVEKFIPPKKGRNHVLRAVMEVLAYEPEGRATDIAEALAFLSRVARRQAVAVLVSDFLGSGWEQAFRIAHSRHDLVPVVVEDVLEQQLPRVGLVPFEDLETGAVTWVDTSSPRVRESYQRAMDQGRLQRDTVFRRLCVEFARIDTTEGYADAVASLLRRRARRVYR